MNSEVEVNELQVFITSTLTAIMKGIGDAQPDAKIKSAFGSGEHAFNAPENVAFDVAVTAKHSGTAKGGLKIQVFSIGIDAGGDFATEAATVSRIQFTVPTRYKKNI